MTHVMRRIWEHRKQRASRASATEFFLVAETIAQTFESPAAADFIKAVSISGNDQVPVALSSEARDIDVRMKAATIPGRIDHGEKTIRMEIRPPGALGGTDNIMGAKVFTALAGSQRIVNTQAEITIDSVQTHTRAAGTIVRVTGSDELLQLGDIVALRSNNAATAAADGETAVVMGVVDNGATADFTLKPAFTAEPFVTGGTPDKLQGGITWKPTTEWSNTYSGLWQQGFEGDAADGGIVPSMSIPIDGRSILVVEFPFHYHRTFRSAIGFVSGTVGTDAFLTTTTVVDVDDASLYQVGAYVNLVKFTVSTGAIAGTEVKALITALDETSTPNTLTLTRGTSPVAQTGGTQDLKAATLVADAEDTVAGLLIAAGDFLAFWIDHRGYIEVPLTAGAGKDAGDFVVDVHAAMAFDVNFGVVADLYGPDADYGVGFASEFVGGGVSKLILTSKIYGSQSQIKPVATGRAGDRFADVWVPATTFERLADSEVQVVPWTPGGSNTITPIINKDGYCRFNGYKHKVSGANFSIDNTAEHDEATKTGDDYEDDHFEGPERVATCAITQPSTGWTSRLRRMAEASTGVVFLAQCGTELGRTFTVAFTKAKVSDPQKSGDNRQERAFTLTAEDPGVTYTATGGTAYTLQEYYIGLT